MEEALRSKKNCVKIRNGDAAKIIYAIIEFNKNEFNKTRGSQSSEPEMLFKVIQAMVDIQHGHNLRVMSSVEEIQLQITTDRDKLYDVSMVKNGIYLLKYVHGLVAINENGYGIRRIGIQVVSVLNTLGQNNENIRKFI